MAPKKTLKKKKAYWKVALQRKLAAQQSKAMMEPKVSLQGDNDNGATSRIEEVEACELTMDQDEEGSI
jgi:hypothetical protein